MLKPLVDKLVSTRKTLKCLQNAHLSRRLRLDTSNQPTTSPHRCLTIPELFNHIIGFLSRDDMVSIALVCRRWHVLATPTLWSIGPVSLLRLLSLLRYKVVRGSHRRHVPQIVIPSNVTLDEWNRFLYAYTCVKDLRLIRDYGSNGVVNSLGDLHKRYGGELVSNVQRITGCKGTEFDEGALPALFFSERLRSIQIHGSRRTPMHHAYCAEVNQMISVFLQRLLEKVPGIRDISIEADRLLDFHFDSFSDLVSLQLNGVISEECFRSIFRCSRLRHLSLGCYKLRSESNTGHSEVVHNTLEELEVVFEGFVPPFLQSIATTYL
ncbi:hypothetical protein FRC03_003191 [Tulasnella sp. 419]|nr:hypothetical protein FRC03_003191 [Tulasnella sp. 419]